MTSDRNNSSRDSEDAMPEAAEVTPDLSAEAGVGEYEGTLYEGLETPEQPEVEPEGEAPELFTVVIDGQEQQVTREEALAGYQRQADYTRKTQEVAAQRAELEQAARLYEALGTDPERTLRALTAAYGFDGTTDASGLDEFEEETPPDPNAELLAQVQEFMQTQQEREIALQIENALTNLHAQHGEFDDEQLIAYAIDKNIPDLDVAYAAMAFADPKLQAARAKAQADAAAAAAKGNLPPVAGGRGVQAGAVIEGAAPTSPADQTIEDSWNAAARELGLDEYIV